MKQVLIFLALVGVLELAARLAIDIKLYGADEEVGYWIAPDQSGGSLLTGSYVINAQGFGTSEPLDLSGPRDLVLVGDSLVFGTSELGQESLLGPTLGRQSDWEVWPLATGSWALANELRALERQDFSGAEAIVFVVNSEDVNGPSYWTSEYDLPRSDPKFYLLYAVQKTIPALRFSEEPITVREGDPEAEWREFRDRTDIPVFVIGYEWSATSGSGCSWMPDFIDASVSCFDPIAMGEESKMLDGFHLSAEGNELFADYLLRTLPTNP